MFVQMSRNESNFFLNFDDNFPFVFDAFFFLLLVLGVFKLFPVPPLSQEDVWMEIFSTQPDILFVLRLSANHPCYLHED